MSFFLIARGPDGSLELISNRSFESRADATAELSRITAEESFAFWDHEVLVGDLQGATPVLVVRPHAESPPEAQRGEEGFGEAPPAKDVNGASAAEPSSDLKEALRRTAVTLEAEGIVAPESVGPAVDVSVAAETAAEGPHDGAPEELAAEQAPALEPAMEAERDSEPEQEPMHAEERPDASVVEAEPPAWPWATAQESKTFHLDALEEPGDDADSLIRAPGDDATLSASRPVILGAYETAGESQDAETAEAPGVAATSENADVDALLADLASVSDGVEAPPAAESPGSKAAEPRPGQEVEPTTGEPVGSGSDFVDLPAVPVDPIESMTCDDCVYTDTCPNKGQRDPASCGSFQWK